MDNLNELNRVRSKMFEIIFAFAQIEDACKKIFSEVTQKDIDSIVEQIQKYQKDHDLLQNYLFDYLNNIVEHKENIEFSAEDTEDGYKI